jgi:hypothetical protein
MDSHRLVKKAILSSLCEGIGNDIVASVIPRAYELFAPLHSCYRGIVFCKLSLRLLERVYDNSADLLHVFAIDSTTGVLGEVSPSPYKTKNQPGWVMVDPAGTHVYLYVSGENVAYPGQGGNQVDAYNLSPTGVLTSVAGTPFLTGSIGISTSGTPGIVTDAAGKFLYVLDVKNLYTFQHRRKFRRTYPSANRSC